MSFSGYLLTAFIIFEQHFCARVPVSPPPPPYLAVKPSSDHVLPGQKLAFHCQAPSASLNQPPKAFLLIRRAKGTPPKLVSRSQQADLTMGREDSGEYSCLYQLTLAKTGQVNSTASQPVQITVIDLPVPTLKFLSQQGGDSLECVGSSAYPQGFFSLFRVGSLSPEMTLQLSLTQHSARFPIPTRFERGTLYQCQYSVKLGNSHLYSKMSAPISLPCIKGHHCTPSSPARVPVSPPLPPYLVVKPSSDHVVPGQKLAFHCQAPSASLNQPPKAFLLIRRAKGTPPKLVSRSQQADFSERTMGREDSGEYSCLYQLTLAKTGQVNSTASQPVQITVIDLPVPTLSLSQQGGDSLECVGSPAYPQGFFSLFRVSSPSPKVTPQLSLTQHSARFPIPTRYERGTLYQCQYSVRLGNSHLYSKMSAPFSLPCIKGHHCTPSSAGDPGRTDLALIIGSVSAGVLFLMVVSLLSFAVYRHVKTLAERRRKREQEKLWQQIHSSDHIIDLPLPHVDFGSENFESAFRGRPSVSDPIYDIPLTTFNNPTAC